MRRWLNILIGLGVSALALALALNGVPIDRVGGQLAGGSYLWAVVCIVISLFSLFLRAVRWRALLNDRITLGHSFNILNIGYFFNAFLPARLGEVARTYLATRITPPIPVFTTISTIVVERLIDTLVVLVLILLAVASSFQIDPVIRQAATIGGVLAVIGLAVLIVFAARRAWAHSLVNLVVRVLPFLKRINPAHLLDRVLDGVVPLTKPMGAARTLFWTATAWIGSVVAAYFLMPTFYPNGNWTAALLMIAFASLAIAFPAVPGSVGPFELAVVLGLRAAGLITAGDADSEARGLALAVVLHIVSVVCYVSTGYLGLVREKITFGQLIDSARNFARSKPATPAAQEGT